MELQKKLKKLKIGKITKNVELKKHTTYKAGGVADFMVFPKDVEKLKKLLTYIKKHNIKHKIIGNGSNLLFSDLNYKGILINLSELNSLEIKDTIIKVGAGHKLTTLALKLSKLGLTGMEFATGIPGTIGGAVYMNAGAYKSDMGYIVSEIKVLTEDLEVKTIYNKDLDFHYRTSFLQKKPENICLEATIILKHGDKNIIMDIIEERRKKRLMTQPLEFPSAGSVFRNPENDFAGRLIEDCNLKGKKIGGAMVSEKHANFIINYNNATGQDIYDLINLVKTEVEKKHKINLRVEQEFVNWE